MKSASGKLTELRTVCAAACGLWDVDGGWWMVDGGLVSCGLESEQIRASLINATALFMCPTEVCLFGALHKVKLN